MTDLFATPAPIPSEFASADSFRGRLVLIQPTGLELDVPNVRQPGKFSDRLTATVTTVDGLGKVQIFSEKAPTGQYLDGPEHKGVWFSQERIVKAVVPERVVRPGTMVLARLETFKPGKSAGLGNPWGLINPTEADKQMARDFLAGRIVAGATAEDVNPFAPKDAPF